MNVEKRRSERSAAMLEALPSDELKSRHQAASFFYLSSQAALGSSPCLHRTFAPLCLLGTLSSQKQLRIATIHTHAPSCQPVAPKNKETSMFLVATVRLHLCATYTQEKSPTRLVKQTLTNPKGHLQLFPTRLSGNNKQQKKKGGKQVESAIPLCPLTRKKTNVKGCASLSLFLPF